MCVLPFLVVFVNLLPCWEEPASVSGVGDFHHDLTLLLPLTNSGSAKRPRSHITAQVECTSEPLTVPRSTSQVNINFSSFPS